MTIMDGDKICKLKRTPSQLWNLEVVLLKESGALHTINGTMENYADILKQHSKISDRKLNLIINRSFKWTMTPFKHTSKIVTKRLNNDSQPDSVTTVLLGGMDKNSCSLFWEVYESLSKEFAVFTFTQINLGKIWIHLFSPLIHGLNRKENWAL